MTDVQPKSEKEESIFLTVYCEPQIEDIKTQFSHHAAQLKLPNSSDQDKKIDLENLIHFAFGFQLSQLHEIVTQSIAIETVYKLMLDTENPKIRTLCGAVLQVVQQRGTENDQITDWRTLLSPIVSFLFSSDQLISELGKQALIEAIEKKPESLQGLIELDVIEHATEELNHFYTSQSSSNQSEQSDSILGLLQNNYPIFNLLNNLMDYTKKFFI
ncbi:MAG: hypothetical protein EZS28_015525 [Streblomastix strix]|uniref:Uncharacterized protein n=1 Tax=Streblomastix strix TaxID=222440 RepID=A0A5J4W215_9EUKA|nr:MAG: hypothetical protein EZS28_015525 [Streblomastix strix]